MQELTRSGLFLARVPAVSELETTMDVRNAFESSRAHSGSAPKGVGLKPPLVLVVDDDPDARVICSSCLTHLGYQTATAENGEDGVVAAVEQHPKAILMDLGMSRLGGLDATRRIKADPRTRDCLVIVVTGQGAEMIPEARAAGCNAYFLKPFNAFLLDAILRAFTSLEKHSYKVSTRRRCPCTREYNYATWLALPFCGRIHSRRGDEAIEVRTCLCGCEIAMRIKNATADHPVA
jgi:CheY-like chemotaxis protein